MFKKILIANRGEIACRVAATARRIGVRTVAVYSDADAHAKHVHACDEAVHIGGSAPRESYLRGERILAAAHATGAEAVHPGYGFLSENDVFARACADAGVVFIGPPPVAIRAMGLKAESKRLMEAAGVPLVPGYHGAEQNPLLLKAEAERIGYPVLIKASAGGGGKGMRVVAKPAEFDAALASCQREAAGSFGSDAVLVERYITRPRHIEIQVFADAHGHCVYLFERDCSVQRRHQKVLEEAPAPAMTPERRAQMGAAAVAAARAVGYVGAGTVEFIVEPDGPRAAPRRPEQANTPSGGSEAQPSVGVGRFYFMEMNTRLQVEHPVTEAITGLDLVEWQLRVAAGEPLPVAQDDLRIDGHAIEARICAENPEADFLPATGTLHVLRTPTATQFERPAIANGVRIDSGVREGDSISPHYDSMIAKLIAWGTTREQALARLDRALADTHIVGLHTNVAFLRRCARSRSFAAADLDTALIDRERAVLFGRPELPLEIAAAGVIARELAAERMLESDDPWSRRDGWRLHGSALRRFDLAVRGRHHVVRLERRNDGAMRLSADDASWDFAVMSDGLERHDLLLDGRRHRLAVYATGERLTVFEADGVAVIDEFDPIAHAADAAGEGGCLAAPMPGRVIALLARAGDVVKKGQALAVIEAMKMEHTLSAPRDGTVAELLHAVGDQVAEGSELLRLADA